VNVLSDTSLTATNLIVQEATVQTYKFTTSSILPGVKFQDDLATSSDRMLALHIFFPETIHKDPENAQNEVVTITGVDEPIVLNGDPSFQIDTSMNYNELCQLYLCYLIQFAVDLHTWPQTITVEISNLLNPESVAMTGDMTITTLMKYTADPIFYKIDTVRGPSSYKATSGDLDPSLMTVQSLTGDLSTAAQNQAYELTFTTTHMVLKGGFIKVLMPKTFMINSVSSTIAQFSVMSEGINYASIFDVN